MEPLRRIASVGVGLIGGSLALALRRAGLVGEVVGIGRSQANLDTALARGIVDRAGTDPTLVAGCELVVLATPGAALAPMAAAIAPHLAADAIVSDAGGVSQAWSWPCSAALAGGRASSAPPDRRTEDSGRGRGRPGPVPRRARVRPGRRHRPDALPRARALGGGRHGRGRDVAAATSCWRSPAVPHLLAFALTAAAGHGRRAPARSGSFAFAGPCSRARRAWPRNSPEMWRDILLANAHRRCRARAGRRPCGARRAQQAVAWAATAPGCNSSCGPCPRSCAASFERAGKEPTVVAPAGRSGATRQHQVPGDKSIAHRALFGGIARHGRDPRRRPRPGQQLDHARAAPRRRHRARGRRVRVTGQGFAGLRAPGAVLDCGNPAHDAALGGDPFARPFTGARQRRLARKRPMPHRRGRSRAWARWSRRRTSHRRLTVRGGGSAEELQLSVASAQVRPR